MRISLEHLQQASTGCVTSSQLRRSPSRAEQTLTKQGCLQESLPYPDEIDRQMAAVEAAVADEEAAVNSAEAEISSQTQQPYTGSDRGNLPSLLHGTASVTGETSCSAVLPNLSAHLL